MKLQLLLAPALLAAPILPAQTASLRAHMDHEAGSAYAAPASLCVLDAKGGRALLEGFTALLQREELKAYEVPLRGYVLGGGAERELVAELRLPPGPRWLLLGRRGQLLAQGEGLPDAAAFAQQLRQAGFRDPVKELQGYLKANPDSVEAHERLLALLRQRGERATQRFMGLQVPSPRDFLDRGDLEGYRHAREALPQADLSKAKALDPVQDLEAWSAFVQEFDAVFRSGQWREMDLAWTREGRPLDAASPSLQALYRRWQPSVEEALRRQPELEPFWDLWIWMSEAQGGRPLAPLLASIKPSPLTARSQWPPDRAAQALRAAAHSPEDWRILKARYQAQWEDEPQVLREPAAEAGATPEVQSALLDQDWNEVLAPLLECCLRGGDPHQAEAFLDEALEASRWAPLAERGAALAQRCGDKALAARWAQLRPGAAR